MPEAFPIFKRQVFPAVEPKVSPVERDRLSPRARGYDAVWDRVAAAHLARHPFCVMCEQQGLTVLADVADHKIAVVDGGPRLEKWNRWGLCHLHHNGLKRRMEKYARDRGLLDQIVLWCDEPRSRPPMLRA